MSIYDNIAFGVNCSSLCRRRDGQARRVGVRKAALWDEVRTSWQSGAGLRRAAAAPVHRPRHHDPPEVLLSTSRARRSTISTGKIEG
jgi:ABC-type phosphate transport system ATPase subunit